MREMLTQDADPMVVSNCMSVIQKVRRPRGHIRSANPLMSGLKSSAHLISLFTLIMSSHW